MSHFFFSSAPCALNLHELLVISFLSRCLHFEISKGQCDSAGRGLDTTGEEHGDLLLFGERVCACLTGPHRISEVESWFHFVSVCKLS
jgi:hypothetical protein